MRDTIYMNCEYKAENYLAFVLLACFLIMTKYNGLVKSDTQRKSPEDVGVAGKNSNYLYGDLILLYRLSVVY